MTNDGGDKAAGKELSDANERTMRCSLRMHNEVQAEKAKVLTLERQMAMIAKKASGTSTQEKNVALDEQYVSGGEEELVFTRPTPSTHIRNLQEIENKEKAKRDMAATGSFRDTANTGRIGKKTSPNWDSDTGLSRDMNPVWENTEYSANSGRQITSDSQSLPKRKIRHHSDRCIPSTARRHQPHRLNTAERQWTERRRHIKQGRNR